MAGRIKIVVGSRVEDSLGNEGVVEDSVDGGFLVLWEETGERSTYYANQLRAMPSESEIEAKKQAIAAKWTPEQELKRRVQKLPGELELPVWVDFCPEEPKEWTL